MKIKQQKVFSPITITPETATQAKAMKMIMDKIGACVASEGCEIRAKDICDVEHVLATKISDAFFSGDVSV